jgi:hypothetical protein
MTLETIGEFTTGATDQLVTTATPSCLSRTRERKANSQGEFAVAILSRAPLEGDFLFRQTVPLVHQPVVLPIP